MNEPLSYYEELNLQAPVPGWHGGSAKPAKPIDCGGPCHCDHYHESDNPDDYHEEKRRP